MEIKILPAFYKQEQNYEGGRDTKTNIKGLYRTEWDSGFYYWFYDGWIVSCSKWYNHKGKYAKTEDGKPKLYKHKYERIFADLDKAERFVKELEADPLHLPIRLEDYAVSFDYVKNRLQKTSEELVVWLALQKGEEQVYDIKVVEFKSNIDAQIIAIHGQGENKEIFSKEESEKIKDKLRALRM